MSCHGSCCAAFPVSRPLGGPEFEREHGGQGFHLISMLQPIGFEEACKRWDEFAGGYRPETMPPALAKLDDDGSGPGGPYFTCKHWNETTRLCGDYENRPPLCADYPYGRACDHGCDCVGTEYPASI